MASVTLEHLTKTYPNGFVSVNDVSLHIEDGEFVIFHGPSGCGKSTILRMIGGLEDITSGEIWLGKDLLNDILIDIRIARPASCNGISELYTVPAILMHMTICSGAASQGSSENSD